MASKGPGSTFPKTDTKESRRKLDAFLVDNQELEALNARLAQFNLFRILKSSERKFATVIYSPGCSPLESPTDWAPCSCAGSYPAS